MILYDLTAAQGYGNIKQHGGGKYAEIVFEALCKAKVPMVVMWDSRRWISDNTMALCEEYQLLLEDKAKSTLNNIVKRNNVKLIYSALPNDELLSYRGCRVVATLHGLRALELPYDRIWLNYPLTLGEKLKQILKSFLPEREAKRGSLRFYHRFFENDMLSIVTVSNHTKYAIASYFPDVDIKKIPVFYSPSTSFPKNAERKSLTENYFLVVSAAREEKNALRAIKAFDKLLIDGKMRGFRMKLTGINKNIFRYNIKNPELFDFCGYVNEEELNNLYANAYALVYPSLTEGFGYPPLEAMRYGVPVLASPFTSISEICGGAAIYFNPLSIEEIKNRMLQIMDNNIYRVHSSSAIENYNCITNKQKDDLNKMVDFIMSNI